MIAPAVANELRLALNAARPRRVRSIEQFAREEVIVPNGPAQGQRLREAFQPAAFTWFRQLDKWEYRRHAYVGPVQSGKTLAGLVVPIMWVLFERCDTAILGAPKLEIAHDKWREDFEPVIKRTRFADLLPTTGAGSRGGTPANDVTFQNGVTLKFMSGQGSDDSRSAFTSRWAFITEADKMDASTEVSREADPVSQIEDRTQAFDRFGGGFLFIECTVSTDWGRIWTEYTGGTNSRLAIACVHCDAWVSPELEHFAGWEDAETEMDAAELGHFFCPACGEVWSQEDRLAANARQVLVHQGQEIDADGNVHGEPKRTRTLGYRVSAVNNNFVSDSSIAIQLWQRERMPEESERRINATKTINQKTFAIPWEPPDLDATTLDAATIQRRVGLLTINVVPGDAAWLCVGVDLRKRQGHFVVEAFRDAGNTEAAAPPNIHVPAYGIFDIASDDLGVDVAMLTALAEFRQRCEAGWIEDGSGDMRAPDAVWIDAGYKGKLVFQFCREAYAAGSAVHFLPVLGRGVNQYNSRPYSKPRKLTNVVVHIGEGYHIEWSTKYQTWIVMIDVDHWKTEVHDGYATPAAEPGAIALYDTPGEAKHHARFAEHMVSERRVSEFVAGKGVATRWRTISRANHWLDAFTYGRVAGDYCGWEVVGAGIRGQGSGVREAAEQRQLTTPDGRAYLATER